MISEDLEKHPQIKTDWDEIYSNLLYSSDEEKGKQYMSERIQAYLTKKELAEKEYTNLAFLYNKSGDKRSADSVKAIILDLFPRGQVSRRDYLMKFYDADLQEKEQIFGEYLKKMEGVSGFERNYMADMLTSAFAGQGNWEKVAQYSSLITDRLSVRIALIILPGRWPKKEKTWKRQKSFPAPLLNFNNGCRR